MSAIQFQTAIPVFRIFDIEKAKAFYVDFLGFQVDWEHRFEPDMPVYMRVSRGTLAFHLTEHHGDCCPGSAVHVTLTGLREFHQEVSARGYKFMRPGLETTFYKTLCMNVTDPFGNQIHFNEPIESASQSS